MKYRAVLFDFDGTLTPSLPLWIKAFHSLLHARDIRISDADVVTRFFFRDWESVASELKFVSLSEFKDEIHGGLRVAFKEAELFPEVLAVLEGCRSRGQKTALVTSAPRAVIEDVMPRLALQELFDHVVCADDVQNFKPHPEPILMTLTALRCASSEAIMIGDSTVDILAGKAAGTATALFMADEHHRFHKPDALRATEPDYIFTHHRELHGIIDNN